MKLAATRSPLALLWIALAAWVSISSAPLCFAVAQDEPPKQAEEAGEEPEAEAEEEADEPEPEDRWFAVTGGDVYTVTRGMLRGATVLAKNGKIHEIGYDIVVPEEADRIDATGLRVYPGLIACNSRGIVGNEPPEDSTDVFALNLILGLSTGITTTVVGNTAAKLTYGTLDGLNLKSNLFQNIRLRSSSDWRNFREALEKIVEFQRKKADHDRRVAAGEEGLEEPKPQGLNQNYMKLLSGEVRGRFDLSSSRDLRRLASLAQQYGFRGVVFGGTEGWVVADEMGRAGLSCVLTPRTTRNENRTSNRPNGARIENAAMLHERGVPVAVVPSSTGISLSGLVGRDLFTLPVEAAYAVRGGMDRQTALESITITAARILGVGDRIGSLEIGKDADLIVTDGDVLHYRTLVHYAVVNGRMAYDKAEESLLSHIRPLDGESRFHPAEILEELEKIHPSEPPADEGEGEGEEEGEGEGEESGEGEEGGDEGEGDGGDASGIGDS